MTTARRLLAALAVAALAVGSAQAEPLKVDTATQQRLGVVTAPLAARTVVGAQQGFARVLDPVPLATLDADIAAAAAALAASQAEARRAQALNATDQTVSKRAAEAATAQARADQARLLLLRRRLGLEWTPAFASLPDAARARLIGDIAAGRAALVRIDLINGGSIARGSASLDLGGGARASAAVLGPSRSGDPRLQTSGALAIVRGPAALRLGTGAVLPASVAVGSGATGVVVPRSALLRAGGATYAYLRRDAASFERVLLENPISQPDGLFVAGLRPGQAVVVRGAAQLLAAETPAPAGD